MTLHIYNTMSRQKEPFVPLEPGKVKMYACGPTVYNYIHIGNARPAIFFDVVRRYLTYTGYDVTYLVNFTDVDDKLIRVAEETGETVPVLAERYIQAYLVKDKFVWIVSCSCEFDDFYYYEEDFLNIVRSLRILG